MNLGAIRFGVTELRARLAMPLLVKELTEMAARRRTYVLRVLYALALYVVFALDLWSRARRTAYYDPLTAYLGYGRDIFDLLTEFQLGAILFFLPALMCGRITQEKERDSLVLLFLTELRPWEIVLQKYIGGLAPMFSFVLLSLPLAGVAYAFGGVESMTLAGDWAGLLVLCLEVGAFALLCSAWCRTTVGALLTTYLLGAAIYFGPKVLLGAVVLSSPAGTVRHWTANLRSERPWELLVPVQSAVSNELLGTYGLFPALALTGIFLVLARCFLVRRASVPPRNFLPRVFAWLDATMKRANRLTGGVMLMREGASLPGDAPVVWRENRRRGLGKLPHIVRLLCVIEIPPVLMCMWVVQDYEPNWPGLVVAAGGIAVVAILILATAAANSLVSERVGQTLDVLLTTPLSAKQIVRQKERALRRLEWVLAVPLLTVLVCQAYLRWGTPDDRLLHLASALLAVAIYLPMITWLSLWIGLRARPRFRAIITVLGILAFWMVILPFTILSVMGLMSFWDGRPSLLLLSSPIAIPAILEAGYYGLPSDVFGTWDWVIVNAAFYTCVALVIRWRLFADAERYLRR
jgi:ABC-type transport system involved in multi-copper enzyme maturation permease subunit